MNNNEKKRRVFSGNPFLEWLTVAMFSTLALVAVKDHDVLGYISAFCLILTSQIISGSALSQHIRAEADFLKRMIKEDQNNENV